ncbi:Phosphoribosylamine--glycine ligase [Nymphon striatum]|nr:Phosphoribosylamine--glycine ligase [Nymphon striatum]
MSIPVVIKADGLAAGKGVIIAETRAQAEEAIDDCFAGSFGEAGHEGEEASLFALCDGQTAMLLGTAQDHKRVGDGDTGPNTGGMGAYSPAPVMTQEIDRPNDVRHHRANTRRDAFTRPSLQRHFGILGLTRKIQVIEGVESAENDGALVFHAGTAADGDKLLAIGGRVLNVTAIAPSVSDAQIQSLSSS